MTKLKVGIQLYSVRQAMKADPYGALAKIAEAGYKFVEAANHNADTDDGFGFGVPANKMKEVLDNLGISIVGSHINPLKLDRLPAILDYHQALGNKQIGCDIEFYPYNDLDYVLRRCDLFNKVGEMCKERGMRYYYHNHYQEFQKIGNKTIYEIIMENTDPSLVFIELDTYWIIRGGQNPLHLIEKYRERLVLLHQKDFPQHAPQPIVMYDGVVDPNRDITDSIFTMTKNPLCFTEIGTGILPIQSIIDAAGAAPNLEYILLEQDHSQLDEIESIKTSMNAFHKFSNIEFNAG
ncbi:hypothetical protein SD70_00995 [Gordoniibacillus kamchatkensis]|uniref:Xylose isomerase-like TIM barrel domain-containing protein n=1 Tax=Gordoniibacillus kamchatkensis TaxID=1590651 RepID=A0ABR5ANS3_9BACL|nr:TIM barrel protein [Paenibacillus sp. VKM B-2647]KIL42498.1 hypothetical protein SD70_00995 [Paenibacillus sp. VKM B-2647]